MQNQYQNLFEGAFDTFKVFDNLTVAEAANVPANAPKSIWQILNHLVVWQRYHIACIKNIEQCFELDEYESWIETQVDNQQALDGLVATFYRQQQQVIDAIATFGAKEPYLQKKLKYVQELSVHLSFHVGEVVLMRRMYGNYPLPHQMKEFLGL
ncbi:DinB family protein [Inquilinus sp. KBS0705]|nr:DinB family protein [Inquilinus sp. KBS0705]